MFHSMPRQLPHCLAGFLLALCAPFLAHASGQVTGPNGEYKESHADLSVRVIGGAVTLERSWLNGRWYFNPAWADLRFTYDALLDGSVKTIDRAGSVFEGGGDLFVFDDRFFIRKTAKVVNDTTVHGWRWNSTAGDWVDYDLQGRIRAYGDRNDIGVRFERNADGKISQIFDHRDALVLSFTYSASGADGKLTRITDRTGRFVQYDWTGNNLTTVRGVLDQNEPAFQHRWSYTYDSNGQIKGGTDPENRSWLLTYMQSYRATGAAVPVGVSFSGLSGRDFRISRVATFKNEAGHTTTYEYDYDRGKRAWSYIRKHPSGRTEASVYDLEGRVIRVEEGNVVTYNRTKDGDRIEYSKDERGQVTRRELDGTRNITKVTYPDGASESWTYHPRFAFPTEHIDARGTKTTYRYDSKGNRLEMIEAVGEPETRTTEYVWNALGQMMSMTIKGATADEDATTAYTYDDYGNIDTITDAEDVITRYTHHVTGKIETTTDGRNKLWTNTYNAAGLQKSSKNPIDPATTYDYDKVGNRTSQTDPAGYITQYRYDGLDRLVKTIDAKQGESTAVYNADGRVTSQSDQSGQTTTFEYDARGRRWKVIDGAGNVTETIYGTHAQALDGLVAAMQYPTYREEYKYDARGRRTQAIRVLDAEHRETTSSGFDADGNTISTTDPLGRTALYAYDQCNRLTETTDAQGGKTLYAYDTRDNLLSLTDANQNTHRFTYDSRDRVKTESRPMGQTHRYRYDANGNLIEKIDARNQKSAFTYDDANRKSKTEYFEASAGTPHKMATFDYDIRGRLTGYDDQTTSAIYHYDELGRKTEESVDYGPFTLGNRYTYQANGQKASYTAPDGTTFTYGYTNHGQLRNIAIPDEGNIAYSDFQWSRAKKVTYPGNTVRTLTFDALMRTKTIQIKNSANEVLMNYGYDYNQVGNITEKTTEHGPYQYGYDALDRLTSADYPNGENNDQINTSFAPNTFPFKDDRFQYDLLGNRLKDQARTDTAPWQYNANNELLDSAFAKYVYNENGSTIEKKAPNDTIEHRYSYDTEERLSEVRGLANTIIATYYYDPFGRRLWKTVSANQPGNDSESPKTSYMYYSDEGYAAEYTHLGAHPGAGESVVPVLGQLYLFAPQGVWSTEPLAIRQGGEGGGWHFTETDHLGTQQGLLSVAGAKVNQSRANVFGETKVVDGMQQLRFAGQIEDAETITNYNYYRQYDAAIGRYSQEDPIGYKGGMVYYGFNRSNTLKYFDPNGLSPQCCDSDFRDLCINQCVMIECLSGGVKCLAEVRYFPSCEVICLAGVFAATWLGAPVTYPAGAIACTTVCALLTVVEIFECHLDDIQCIRDCSTKCEDCEY